MCSQEQTECGEGMLGRAWGSACAKAERWAGRGPVGKGEPVVMAKNPVLGPDARVQVPSSPSTHGLTSGHSCNSTSPHVLQQRNGAKYTFVLQVSGNGMRWCLGDSTQWVACCKYGSKLHEEGIFVCFVRCRIPST